MTRPVALLAIAVVLGGCTPVAVPPRDLTPIDLTLTRACDAPMPKPAPPREMTGREVLRRWSLDRLALVDCGRRFAATVRIYEARDRRLAGE